MCTAWILLRGSNLAFGRGTGNVFKRLVVVAKSLLSASDCP